MFGYLFNQPLDEVDFKKVTSLTLKSDFYRSLENVDFKNIKDLIQLHLCMVMNIFSVLIVLTLTKQKRLEEICHIIIFLMAIFMREIQ
jgi:hypothetical protein